METTIGLKLKNADANELLVFLLLEYNSKIWIFRHSNIMNNNFACICLLAESA